MLHQSTLTCSLVAALVVLLAPANLAALPSVSAPAASAATPAVKSAPGYEQPPKAILDVMRAPSPPTPYVSPTLDKILLVSWQDYPPMSRVAAPFLRLAGVRVDPANHSKRDTPGGYGIKRCVTGFELVGVADAARWPVALPAGACPDTPIWSADGKRFAFANVAAQAVELWIGDARTGTVHKVPGASLNPMFNGELQWMPDQTTLLVKLVPEGMGAPPPKPRVPGGPSIQETGGQQGQSSTYENRDTLGSPHDEDLFDYYAAAQPAWVDASTSVITRFGKRCAATRWCSCVTPRCRARRRW